MGNNYTAPGKNLFICGTPLQSLLIRKIMEFKGLQKKDCSLFFYTYEKNNKNNYYYKRLAECFSESYYYLCLNRYPGYVIESRRIFSRMQFDNIYFAAVNSNFVLSALSLGKHKAIYTFDDGTANVSPRSPYAKKHGLSWKKLLGLGVFGNRYTIQRIRNESLEHYTIYPGFRNTISDRLVPIDILAPVQHSGESKKCSIIFGTVFREAFVLNEIDGALKNLARFARSLEGDVYYLPHPRSMETVVQGCQLVESDRIAEDIIGDIYQQYSVVDLYGFSSSAQVNLAQVPGITNYFLTASGYRFSVQEMAEIMTSAGFPSPPVINLDDYNG